MLPLEGIRVLDMTVVWAGPYATSFLADLGAEVIRIESTGVFIPMTRGPRAHPTEAEVRSMPGFAGSLPGRTPGARPWNRAPGFNAHARNKHSMTVDLLRPEGMEVFKRLVKISDVFVENNPTETMEKLGISFEMLQDDYLWILLLRMPAYGNTGPYQNFRAYGLHMEGVIGHTLLRGYPGMDPSSTTSVLVADAAAGATGAFAVLAALHYRRRTGKGQLIELAQAENTIPYLGRFFMDYSMNKRNSTTMGNGHPHFIQGCYPCLGDDRWVTITISGDDDWEAFCRVLGNPSWCRDQKFADTASRYRHHNELDSHISRWTGQQDHYQVMHLLQEAGVAAGPVMDQRDAYDDPHLDQRGMFEEVSQEDTGTHRYPRATYIMSETPMGFRRGPVRMGEDNEYVYKTLLHYTGQEYAELEAQGHIGMDYRPEVP